MSTITETAELTLETVEPDTPVGITETARLLGVASGVVRQWKWRGQMPAPEFEVNGAAAWPWATIESWAAERGRLPARAGRAPDAEPNPPTRVPRRETPPIVPEPEQPEALLADLPKRYADDGTRLCNRPTCDQVHRAKGGCRAHYHDEFGR